MRRVVLLILLCSVVFSGCAHWAEDLRARQNMREYKAKAEGEVCRDSRETFDDLNALRILRETREAVEKFKKGK